MKKAIPVYIVPHPGIGAGLLIGLIAVVFIAFWKAVLIGIGCWILYVIGESLYIGYRNARIQRELAASAATRAAYIADQVAPKTSLTIDSGRVTPFAPVLQYGDFQFYALDPVNQVLMIGMANGSSRELIDLKNLVKVEEIPGSNYSLEYHLTVPGKRRPVIEQLCFNSQYKGRPFFEALDDICYELHGAQG